MSKNEQFDGEFTESDPNNGSAKQPISKQDRKSTRRSSDLQSNKG